MNINKSVGRMIAWHGKICLRFELFSVRFGRLSSPNFVRFFYKNKNRDNNREKLYSKMDLSVKMRLI